MESWPVQEEEPTIVGADVRGNLESARELMQRHDLDALVVTSADRYLNEYTPRADNHRFFLSGFTGSTALMLVPREGRARLFVDGRYHLQADKEVDHELIDVRKISMSGGLMQSLLDDVRTSGRVGYEADRVSQALANAIESAADDSHAFLEGELGTRLGRGAPTHEKPIDFIDSAISGRTVEEKLAAVFARLDRPEATALIVGALDDIAWLTEGRGYHFRYQSSFAAAAVATTEGIHVCVDPAVLARGMAGASPLVHWHDRPVHEILGSSEFDGKSVLRFDPGQTTAAAVGLARRAREAWKMETGPSPVVAEKAIKTAAEIAHLEASNERSCRAISRTILWVRERFAAGEAVNEAAFYEAANAHYEAEGARDLSFHTIAAVGANTAVIHFSDPAESVVAGPDDLLLLDSGALYEGGFATDITRAFLAAGRRGHATDEQKKVYTLVLKGLLNAMSATFPEGTRGAFLDSLARAPIYAAGYDYAHGTGHGVGIHVHEPGVGLSPVSNLPLRAGHVSSIEPGIYLAGFGGVRIENVVTYEPHPSMPGFLRSRPLNFVDYDENLIEPSLLTDEEREQVAAYRAECARRGTDQHEAS